MEKGKSIDQIKVGDFYESITIVSDQMIKDFAAATGDDNPIHLDDAAGAASIFKKRVAHGMLTAGFISAIFGAKFPGVGTIYLGQTLKFMKPVFPGDSITCRVEVTEILADKNRINLNTTAKNQNGDTVLAGEAQVMPPR